MNYIVAYLLLCYDMNFNDVGLEGMGIYIILLADIEIIDDDRDKNVFYLFIHIMNKHEWRSMFIEGFPGLHEKVKHLEFLVSD